MNARHLFYVLVLVLFLVTVSCAGSGEPTAGTTLGPRTLAHGSVFPAAEIRADFDALVSGLREAHADLYARVDQSAYDARYRAERAAIGRPMALADIEVLFQHFVAAGNIAHARVEFPSAAFEAYRAGGGTTVPFFVRVVDGQVRVTEIYGEEETAGGQASKRDPTIEPGDTIHALDGAPIDDWLARLVAHISADTPYLAHALLELWFPRLMWLEMGDDAQSIDVTVRRPDGAVGTVTVALRSRDAILASAETASPVLELDWMAREVRMLDNGIAYLRPGPFMELGAEDAYDANAFRSFIDDAFDQVLGAGSRALLIDLRSNPGGDNSFSDPMIAWFADRPFRFYKSFRIRVSPQTTASNQARVDQSDGDPDRTSTALAALYADQPAGAVVDYELPFAEPRLGDRFEGEVFVLVNRHTFSNAVNVAAIVQDYGFGTILGEETADLATTYGAMERFTLPHTGISVGYPKALITRPNGETPNGETQPRGVVPDLVIPTPVLEPVDDPVLRAAIEHIRSRR